MNDWLLAAVIGSVFVGLMLVAHWFWAEFMLTPSARNFFFGADQWDYSSRLGDWRYQYWNREVDASGNWSAVKFATGMGIALVIAIFTSRVGLAWGKSMSRVKR